MNNWMLAGNWGTMPMNVRYPSEAHDKRMACFEDCPICNPLDVYMLPSQPDELTNTVTIEVPEEVRAGDLIWWTQLDNGDVEFRTQPAVYDWNSY